MQNHIKDFGSYLTESLNEQRQINDGAWILYYWYNYIPQFISAHGSKREAEAAWYRAIENHFGDEIQEWMEGNLPHGVESIDALSAREFDRLQREGVLWASDDLAGQVEFNYDTLKDLKKRDDYYATEWDKFRKQLEASIPASSRYRPP